MHLNNIRIYFMGTNLVTFSSFKLWDPELGSSNGQKNIHCLNHIL